MADLQLHTLLLCDYALTAQDGKISAIGVFSQINVGRLPATHGRCFIVAILEATPGPHELTLQVMSPSGKPTIQQAPRLRIEVPANATTANIVADLKGMRIEEIGIPFRSATMFAVEGDADRGDRPTSDRGPCRRHSARQRAVQREPRHAPAAGQRLSRSHASWALLVPSA